MNATFSTAAAQLVPLAQELDENKVTPGLLGFVIFALIGGALWLLLKNMNKQFAKVNFEEAPVARRDQAAQEVADAAPAAQEVADAAQASPSGPGSGS